MNQLESFILLQTMTFIFCFIFLQKYLQHDITGDYTLWKRDLQDLLFASIKYKMNLLRIWSDPVNATHAFRYYGQTKAQFETYM